VGVAMLDDCGSFVVVSNIIDVSTEVTIVVGLLLAYVKVTTVS
jgi:hypothetical protein